MHTHAVDASSLYSSWNKKFKKTKCSEVERLDEGLTSPFPMQDHYPQTSKPGK